MEISCPKCGSERIDKKSGVGFLAEFFTGNGFSTACIVIGIVSGMNVGYELGETIGEIIGSGTGVLVGCFIAHKAREVVEKSINKLKCLECKYEFSAN